MDKSVENVARRFKEACACATQQQAAEPGLPFSTFAEQEGQPQEGGEMQQQAVSPPGWEETVKHMKKHPEIDNPWALAWYMKNKGYESHKEGSSFPLRILLAAQEEMQQQQGQQGQQAQMQQEAVAPPGWEDTVKKMKKHKEIDNPWALAWYMKNKGAEPHHASSPRYLLAAYEAFKRHQAKAAKTTGK